MTSNAAVSGLAIWSDSVIKLGPGLEFWLIPKDNAEKVWAGCQSRKRGMFDQSYSHNRMWGHISSTRSQTVVVI